MFVWILGDMGVYVLGCLCVCEGLVCVWVWGDVRVYLWLDLRVVALFLFGRVWVFFYFFSSGKDFISVASLHMHMFLS